MSPFNAWVLIKGLETLELRIKQQMKNTNLVIEYLQKSKYINKIYYPFLNDSPQIKLAMKQMKGGGNVVSYEINAKTNEKKQKSFSFLNKLSLIDISNNLGDTKSLITHPETTTHHRLNEKEKRELGITKNLIRLSVGLEDPEDIIEDIDNSLENLK